MYFETFRLFILVVVGGFILLYDPPQRGKKKVRYIRALLIVIMAAVIFWHHYKDLESRSFDPSKLLMTTRARVWRVRKFTNNPQTYWFKNEKEIKTYLVEEVTFLNELVDLMLRENMPCIAPYYLVKDEYVSDVNDEEVFPNFVIVNHGAYLQSNYLNTPTYQTAQLLYLFNPVKNGGSPAVDTSNTPAVKLGYLELEKHSGSVQVATKMPFVHGGKVYVKNTALVYSGPVADCIRNYWDETTPINI